MTIDPRPVEDALHSVLDGALVVKWVLVAETIDSDSGTHQVEMVKSEAASLWDVLGLCDFMASYYRQQIEQ